MTPIEVSTKLQELAKSLGDTEEESAMASAVYALGAIVLLGPKVVLFVAGEMLKICLPYVTEIENAK